VTAPSASAAERLELFGERAPYHSHSLGLIQLFLQLVLNSAVGLRGAASVLDVVSFLFPTPERAPSPNGGQMWLLRLGLYELSRPKERADDWVWLIDHTIQIGRVKCLVVAAVRLSAWEAKRKAPDQSAALRHHDLSVWKIEPVEKSDGPTVYRQLEALSQQTGVVPRAVLNDCGADLQNGVARFCADHSQTTALNDIAHAASNAVKRELNHDPQWIAFMSDTSHAKAKLRQTKFAFLLPPELKAKARWMNLDPLLTWSRKALAFVATPRPVPGVTWEADELEESLGWLRGYQAPLALWSRMLEVTATCLQYIRQHGYHALAKTELAAELAHLTADAQTPAARVAERLLFFVEEQSTGIPDGQRLLGSSEVLESLIGKAKQLEGRQSKSGFTKMVLGLAASVSKITNERVTAALSAIKVVDVTNWIQQCLGTSVQAQRQHAFATLPSEQK
jgi:hypothetical protein